MSVLNIWGQPAEAGDPLPNGRIFKKLKGTTLVDREKYTKVRMKERSRRAQIRLERPYRLYKINEEWLSIGCQNPKCKYHRNGFLALEEAKKTHPMLNDLPEEEQYEYAIKLFEWNHIDRDKKTDNVSNIVREWFRVNDPQAAKRLYEKLQQELSNCEQLCVTCHRLETHLFGHYTARASTYSTYEELMTEKYGDSEFFCDVTLRKWCKQNDKLMGKYDEQQDLIMIFNVNH